MTLYRTPIVISFLSYKFSDSTFTGIVGGGVAAVIGGKTGLIVDNCYFSKCGYGAQFESGVFYFDDSGSSTDIFRSCFFDCFSQKVSIQNGNSAYVKWNQTSIMATKFLNLAADTLSLSSLIENSFNNINITQISVKESIFQTMLYTHVLYSLFYKIDSPKISRVSNMTHTAIILEQPSSHPIAGNLIASFCYFPQYFRERHEFLSVFPTGSKKCHHSKVEIEVRLLPTDYR